MANIGFIGLGNMGSNMAANLVKAGHRVFAFDLSAYALKLAKEAGCKIASNINEASSHADIIITMLPSGKEVREIYSGKGGVFENAKMGTLLIDCSTIDIKTAREIGALALEKGFLMIDAPVSGGIIGAKAATLTFMVGGEKTSFEKAKPILENMGKRIFHAGNIGNGQAAKICNNMLLGIHMIGTCEAFMLAEKLGLDAQTFYDISSVSSGQNWSMTSYCPVPGPVPNSPANNDYQAGFSAAMMLKDLLLAENAANQCDTNTPLGNLAARLYEKMAQNGMSQKDFSAIIKLL